MAPVQPAERGNVMIDGGLPFPHALALALGAYGLGSVPFGLLIARLMRLGDLRKIGSGNIGATNVLRTGNRPAALATLVLDGGKGAAAVYIAAMLTGSDRAAAIAAVASVLGHCFPVWLGFKGGKGVATGMGAVAAMQPLAGLAMALVWLTVAALRRISSLAALLAYGCCPVALYLLAEPGSKGLYTFAGAVIAAVSWWRHRNNIVRILDGSEPRIGS